MMREPWKSQGGGVGAGAGLDVYRVVQHPVREPWKSKGAGIQVGAGLVQVQDGPAPGEGAMEEPRVST